MGAYAIDVVVGCMMLVVVSMVIGFGQYNGPVGALIGGVMALLLGGGYLVGSLMLFANGCTIGKRALGMRVIKESGATAGFGTMFVRETVGKMLSGMLVSLGFLWILFDPARQGWHDKLVSTYVVE